MGDQARLAGNRHDRIGSMLSDDDMWAIIQYERSFSGGHGRGRHMDEGGMGRMGPRGPRARHGSRGGRLLRRGISLASTRAAVGPIQMEERETQSSQTMEWRPSFGFFPSESLALLWGCTHDSTNLSRDRTIT